MDFEEREKQKKRHLIRVAIAEAGMVFSVIVIVTVAILVAMGFFVSSEGNIEQSGLAQIHSMPTGGSVELDGTTLFARTNLSRTLSAGEHQIKISRDGYDSWEKTIKMYSGLLVRLYYPRLFLQNRTAEEVKQLGVSLAFYSVSDGRTSILYANEGSVEWELMNIRGDETRLTKLDLGTVLLGSNETEKKFDGKIEVVEWSNDDNYVLIRSTVSQKIEWILVNLKDVAKSLNLTKTFGLNFERIEMIDGAASQLFALENHHLRRINTTDQAISRVLLDNILSFDNYAANVIYVATRTQDDKTVKRIGVYRDDEKGGTVLREVEESEKVQVALTKYYDEDYMIYVVGDKTTVLYGSVPSYHEGENNDAVANLQILVEDMLLQAEPDKVSVSPDGEYVVAQKENRFMTIDLDMGDLYEYDAGASRVKWLADGMMYDVDDAGLKVWDFDNTNVRTLVRVGDEKDNNEDDSSEVTTLSKWPLVKYPVVIANNDRWLYYPVKKENKVTIMREKIRE